ncbi:MAG: hypothetical protein QW801_06515, partial [Candidatus Caldarchaeum sp.]
MSEAFVKAYKHVREQLEKNTPETVIQEKMPEFRDGVFVVNRYVPSDPPMLGMALKNPGVQITRETIVRVERFAKRRGLLMQTEGENIYLVSKDGVKRAGFLRSNNTPTLRSNRESLLQPFTRPRVTARAFRRMGLVHSPPASRQAYADESYRGFVLPFFASPMGCSVIVPHRIAFLPTVGLSSVGRCGSGSCPI